MTFEQLDALAYAVSDLSAAKRVNAARDALLADLDPYAALGAPTPGKHAA